ncbi:transglycosylase domain-containing protein [Cellulomonas sp. ICMP 17802]|uniref:transglycosylase domain-containing protein n=1 Tax=Cellulomonas sp. ICMP 17802 TaxID=3239199 RepID=UPI00351BC142
MAGTNRRAPARGKRSAPRGSTSSSGSSAPKRRFFDYPRTGFHGLHRWLPSWRVVLGTVLTVGFLGMGAVVGAYAFTKVPNPADDTRAQTSTVYFAPDADGTPPAVMGTFAMQKRQIVDTTALPPYVGQSVAAAEDKTFFTNNSGVSVTGMTRALINNLRGGKTQGGSTLTQQYVERYYVDKTTTDYVGKFKETLLAIKVAKSKSKAQIMDGYLNTIYWGRDSYGIQAAAQAYFGVDASALTVEQAALLAGIIPSPNNWDPAVSPAKAEARWNIVLDSMEEQGWVDPTARAAMVFPPTIAYAPSETMRGTNGYLLQMVIDELEKPPYEITRDELNRSGYNIVTTIDKKMQDLTVDQVNQFMAGTLEGQSGKPADNGDDVAARVRPSITSVDPKTGAILALYGGPDYLTDSKNRATYDAIQGGSTFKPFTLITALSQGIPLTTKFNGHTPQVVPGWDPANNEPVRNFDNEQEGTIDLVKATAQSVNTVYAQLNMKVGPENTAKTAEAAGVGITMGTNPANVLGTDLVNPLDMASAYGTIASGGTRHDPYIVATVKNSDGTVAFEHKVAGESVFAADVMADTTYAMQQVVESGSGKDWVKPLGRPIAGKTGTASLNKSAWFIGFTPNIVTEVSLSQQSVDGKGIDTITPFGKTKGGRTLKEVTGGSWPAFLWASYMKQVFAMPAYVDVVPFPDRANVGTKGTPTAAPSTAPTTEPTTAPTEQAPAAVNVPGGLEGKLEADASAALFNVGLNPTITSEPSDTVTSGRVIRVEPGGGTSLPPGSSVGLVISTGPKAPPTTAPTPAPTPTP